MYMTASAAGAQERFDEDRSLDARLVEECLVGNQDAWSALIDRYKNLIFSIPLRYGLSRDDAADIFQEVCVCLLSHLSHVKDPKALPKWLIQVTAHKCFHWKRRLARVESSEPDEESYGPALQAPAEMIELVRIAEQEQFVREAIGKLSPRCQRMVNLLFFEDPPRPYREIASELGVAVGSIGLLRQRCIQQLRDALTEIGISSIEKL
jgi:RNA polymerase sigma factor (sigma-70 family)